MPRMYVGMIGPMDDPNNETEEKFQVKDPEQWKAIESLNDIGEKLRNAFDGIDGTGLLEPEDHDALYIPLQCMIDRLIVNGVDCNVVRKCMEETIEFTLDQMTKF